MFSDIIKGLEKPKLYQKTEGKFWDDEHISKQMLKAHLDPDFEGASRKEKFIEESARWINQIVPPATYPLLLDMGCGPGIYAEKFTKLGYQVTGVDYSRRSIDYGRTSARKQNLDIEYIYENYLHLNLQKQFDVITLIYCDYGALPTNERKMLLEKALDHLKPGGKLLLDVFSIVKFNAFEEKQTWAYYADGGFWRGDAHLALHRSCKYLDHVTLEQTTILNDRETANYYLWTTYFTKETLVKEVTEAGFTVCDVLGDVKGSPYTDGSHTIAIVLEK